MTATHELYCRLLDAGYNLQTDGDRLVVSPASRLTAEQTAAITADRDALFALVDGIPAQCIGRRVCAVVGVCGRIGCLVASEHDRFAEAIEFARAPTNPHRVSALNQDGAGPKDANAGRRA